MITLKIPDIKKTMDELLKGTLFDEFEVRNIEVHTFTKFYSDGILNKSFLTSDEKELYNRNYILWKEIKPHIFNIIRGKKPPTYFKIVFSTDEKLSLDFSSDISGLFMNLIYSQGKLSCTSGIALKTFSLDKQNDHEWDEYIRNFFKEAHIYVE